MSDFEIILKEVLEKRPTGLRGSEKGSGLGVWGFGPKNRTPKLFEPPIHLRIVILLDGSLGTGMMAGDMGGADKERLSRVTEARQRLACHGDRGMPDSVARTE